MKSSSAFVPGHITGFFQVCDEFEDPARIGSRNCGLCIDAGVSTEVEVEKGPPSDVQIYINEKKSPSAKTSRWVVKEVLKNHDEARAKVEHLVQGPIGSGYGMSGAGAIGVAMSLIEALGSRPSRSQISSLAHRAEVSCNTGLGDVGAQVRGGMVVGLEPGCPPHGRWMKVNIPKNTHVVCGTFEPLLTSSLLSDPDFRSASSRVSRKALEGFRLNPGLKRFMEVSQKFAYDLGMLDEELEEILNGISPRCRWGASVVMLGRAIFAPAQRSEVKDVERNFLDFFDRGSVLVSAVDFKGARITH